MKKRWFNRLLLSYLPVIFVVTTILIISFYIAISQLSKWQAMKSNEIFTINVVQSVDQQLRTIENIMVREIMTDDRFQQFLDKDSRLNYYIVNYNASEKLRDIVVNTLFVDSVYIYRKSDNMVLSSNSYDKLENFEDREFIYDIIEKGTPSNWSNRRIYGVSKDSEQSGYVVSIIKNLPLITGNQGFMVVNVNISKIKKMVEEMSTSRYSFIEITDRQNQTLMAGNQKNTGKSDVANKKFGKELTRIKSDYTGWDFHSGLRENELYDFISVLSYTYIAIGIMVIISGCLWIAFLSRRNYKPIESLIYNISSFIDKENLAAVNKSGQDEFKLIENTINNLLEQSSKYRKQHEEDIVFKRKEFLREMLVGNLPITREQWNLEMEQLMLNPEFKQLTVVVIEIDKYLEFSNSFSYRDQNLFKFVLSSVVKEIAQNNLITVWTEWMTGSQMVVLYQLTDDPMESQDRVSDLCYTMSEWMQENLNELTITLGVGTIIENICDVSQSYQKALIALSYKSALGNNRIIEYSEISTKPKEQVFKYLQSINAIAQAFRSDEDGWEREIGIFFEKITSNFYSREDINELMGILIHHLCREITRLSDEAQEIWNNSALPCINDIMIQFDTVEDIKIGLLKILRDTSLEFRRLRESRSNHVLVKRVKEYIELHYSDRNLSLDGISEEFNINSSYLSRLFKDEFGEKFVDYLIRIRIEQVKKLLMETNDTIEQISGKVGYTNAISLIRTFKKVVGITPGDFRKRIEVKL